ncbi:hypothetical protein VIGAN_UM130100, partial [Vigna angularis var. angularis]
KNNFEHFKFYINPIIIFFENFLFIIFFDFLCFIIFLVKSDHPRSLELGRIDPRTPYPFQIFKKFLLIFFLKLRKKSDRHQAVAATGTVATVDLLGYKSRTPPRWATFSDLTLCLSFSLPLFLSLLLFLERLDF